MNKSKTNGAAPTDLVICRESDVAPKAVVWVWKSRLARGKHTTVAGEPGTSKSQFTIFVTAAITTAGRWPRGEGDAPLGNVIILSAEDGVEDTIVPRLIAAGADLNRVHIIKAVNRIDGKGVRSFSLQDDLDKLERAIEEVGDVVLIIIDPVSSYFRKADETKRKNDSHKIDDVRSVLEPVGLMAERTGVAILSVTHFSKSSGGPSAAKALHKFIGSIGFVAAPRIAFAVLEDPEDKDRRFLLHAKNNLAPPPPGLAYRLQQVVLADDIAGDIEVSCLDWESGTITQTADEIVSSGNKRETPQLDEAKALLKSMVPAAVEDLQKEAKAAGISWDTMKRAKGALKLKTKKTGMDGGWEWRYA